MISITLASALAAGGNRVALADADPQKSALRWLKKQGVPARGHVMVWPGYRHLPEWIPSLEKNPETLEKVIDYVKDESYSGQGRRERNARK